MATLEFRGWKPRITRDSQIAPEPISSEANKSIDQYSLLAQRPAFLKSPSKTEFAIWVGGTIIALVAEITIISTLPTPAPTYSAYSYTYPYTPPISPRNNRGAN